MRIGIIGGIERGQQNYERLAAEWGHEVELHGGHMHGRGGRSLDAIVQRSDIVVIVIDVNSHMAVQSAKLAARKYGRRTHIARNFGIARFSSLLATIAAEEQAAHAAGA